MSCQVSQPGHPVAAEAATVCIITSVMVRMRSGILHELENENMSAAGRAKRCSRAPVIAIC